MVVVVIVVVHNDHEPCGQANFLKPTAGLCRDTFLPLPALWNAYDLFLPCLRDFACFGNPELSSCSYFGAHCKRSPLILWHQVFDLKLGSTGEV